jgi:hypothetical protein
LRSSEILGVKAAMSNKTCGELYLEALSEIVGDRERMAFAAGFVNGQAAKVYLHACPAAMFRPSNETFGWLLDIVVNVCERYGLRYEVLQTGAVREIWITRIGMGVGNWYAYEKDSPMWHKLRAQACGIPESETDVNYHKRVAYEQPCDQGAWAKVQE